MRVTCSHCRKTLGVPDKYAGMAIRCPVCSTPVDVPNASIDGLHLEPLAPKGRKESPSPRQLAAAQSPAATLDDHRSDPSPAQHWRGNYAGLAGGVLMLISALWLAIAWYCNTVFFYPPILFVIGLISFIKGLSRQEAWLGE